MLETPSISYKELTVCINTLEHWGGGGEKKKNKKRKDGFGWTDRDRDRHPFIFKPPFPEGWAEELDTKHTH